MKRVNLDQRAGPYVAQQLQSGWTLSKGLLRLGGPIDAVWAHVPQDIDSSTLNDLSGAELKDELSERDLSLARLIKGHLDSGPRRCAVFEHVLAQPSDSYLEHAVVPWFASKGEVYFYLLGPGHTLESILRLMQQAQTYRLVGALTEAPASLTAGQRAVAPETLEALAQAASRVIVLAWHMTGKLVWDVSPGPLLTTPRRN
jgi:hypothetical protein